MPSSRTATLWRCCPAEGGLPVFADPGGIFDGAGVFEDAAGGQHRRRRRTPRTARRLGPARWHSWPSRWGVADQPVEPEPGNVQHIGRGQGDSVEADGRFVPTCGTHKPVCRGAAHAHLVRHEQVQADDLIAAVADDLGERVSLGGCSYTWSGSPAMASDWIRTQEYTAVICMAERSVTFTPAVVGPNRNE